MYVLVTWNDNQTPWAVVAENRYGLPPGPTLSSLRAQHLLDALASGRSLAQMLREELESRETRSDAISEGNLDPLKRLEVEGSLLRRGRALAASLSAMQRRLGGHPVITVDTLRARLASPLGPEFVATKVAEAYRAGQQTQAEAVFTISEIALAVGRVEWAHVLKHVDPTEGLELVTHVIGRLDAIQAGIGEVAGNLASYASRAAKEAIKCLQL